MRDMHHSVDVKITTPVAVYTQASNPTPVAIELKGFNAAEIVADVGVGGITFTTTNKIELVAEHSDNGTDYVALETKDVLGGEVASGGILKTFAEAHAAAAVYRWGYIGNKAYLRVKPVFGGTHSSGTPFGVNILRGHPANTIE